MILDNTLLFSLAQTSSATTGGNASTNVLDIATVNASGQPGAVSGLAMTNPKPGDGDGLSVFMKVDAWTVGSCTGLTVALQHSTTAGGTYVTAWSRALTATEFAALAAGYEIKLPDVPRFVDGFLRLLYTAAGANPTTSTFTAGLVADVQS